MLVSAAESDPRLGRFEGAGADFGFLFASHAADEDFAGRPHQTKSCDIAGIEAPALNWGKTAMRKFVSKYFKWLFIISQVACFFLASLTNVEFALRYLVALCLLNIVGYVATRATRETRDVVREPVLLFVLISPVFTFAIMAELMSRNAR
jgi:hypothetical protein